MKKSQHKIKKRSTIKEGIKTLHAICTSLLEPEFVESSSVPKATEEAIMAQNTAGSFGTVMDSQHDELLSFFVFF
jgi:hypothetical protein